MLKEVAHVLSDSVRSSLVPLRTGGRLLRGENIYKAAREIIELVASLDMPVQRHTVELGQHIDRAQPRVQAIANRNIDDSIFTTERHRRFGAVFRQREQARASATAHNDGKRALKGAWRQRSGRFYARIF